MHFKCISLALYDTSELVKKALKSDNSMLHKDIIDSSYIILVTCMHFSIYSEMNSVEIQ